MAQRRVNAINCRQPTNQLRPEKCNIVELQEQDDSGILKIDATSTLNHIKVVGLLILILCIHDNFLGNGRKICYHEQGGGP